MARFESPYRSQHSAKLADRVQESARSAADAQVPGAAGRVRGRQLRDIAPPASPIGASIGLASMGGSKQARGGRVRAVRLSQERRREIAQVAARKRWGK